ncbi:MAG: hypothetical protein FJ242_00035 [Nitrospira sp.]|nr:hypothetical protein [Nitrospira sp.]
MWLFRTFLFFIVLFCSLSFVSAQQNLRIAVMNFENHSSYGGKKYSQKAADLMMNELTKSGVFTVVERKRLDALLQEQDFQSSGNVDPQTAVKIGKMLGADIVVLGTIDKLGVGTKKIRVGDSTITRYSAFANVNIRAVNVQTGAILFSDSDEASVDAKSATVPGYDMGSNTPSVDGPLKTTIQRLSKRFIETMKSPDNRQKGKPSVL